MTQANPTTGPRQGRPPSRAGSPGPVSEDPSGCRAPGLNHHRRRRQQDVAGEPPLETREPDGRDRAALVQLGDHCAQEGSEVLRRSESVPMPFRLLSATAATTD
jgi:hypothetical protein